MSISVLRKISLKQGCQYATQWYSILHDKHAPMRTYLYNKYLNQMKYKKLYQRNARINCQNIQLLTKTMHIKMKNSRDEKTVKNTDTT